LPENFEHQACSAESSTWCLIRNLPSATMTFVSRSQ
jgi:hypothetical protein